MGVALPDRSCPYCGGRDVDRLFVASTRIDACRCRACGARWDEDQSTGVFLGRADRQSAAVRSPR